MAHPIRLALAALAAVAALGACSPAPGMPTEGDMIDAATEGVKGVTNGGASTSPGPSDSSHQEDDDQIDADRLALDACTKLVSFLEEQENRKGSLIDISAPSDPADPWAQVEAMNNSRAVSDGTHPALRDAYTSYVTPLTQLTGGAARRDPSWDALHQAMTTSAANGYNAPGLASECGKALAE